MTESVHRQTQLFDFQHVPLWRQAIAAVAYVALAYLSGFATDSVSGFTSVWIPTGVSVGLLYIWGYPTWLGSAVGGLVTQIIFYNGWATLPDVLLTLLIVTIGTAGNLLGVYWTTHVTGNRYFLGHAKDTVYFVICNCFLSPLLAAILTPFLLCALGKFGWDSYRLVALSSWMGDAFGILTITSLIITWHGHAVTFRDLLKKQPVEGAIILFLMLIVSQIAFGQGYPVEYTVVPLVVWAAFRFGEAGATLLMVSTAAIAIIGTVQGHSSFAHVSLGSTLTLLQSFIAFISITTLILSAVINENEKAKIDLQKTNLKLTQFLNALPVGVNVHNQDGTALYSNQVAQQLLKTSQNTRSNQQSLYCSIYQANTSALYPSEQLPIARALMGENLLVDDLEVRHGSQIIPLEMRGTPILDEQGRVTSAIVTLQDISERKRAEAILADYTRELELEVTHRTHELAHTNQQLQREIQEREHAQDALCEAIQKLQQLINIDGLTQIANRRCFDERLRREWQRSAREQQPLALILLDVDYFKRFNDCYGHQAGDECLIQVAQAVAQAVKRPDDLAARYGGEEFAIILPNTTYTGAISVAERIQRAVQDLEIFHKQSEVSKTVTISMGIAQATPQKTGSIDTFINLADQALYDAKRSGRNQYAVCSEKGPATD